MNRLNQTFIWKVMSAPTISQRKRFIELNLAFSKYGRHLLKYETGEF